MMPSRLKHLALLATVSLMLSACAATNDITTGDPVDSLQGQKAMTERRLTTAAVDAIHQGRTAEALDNYEKLYARNGGDADIAVNYAQLLRRTGSADQSLKVLSPFVKGKKKANAKAPLPMIKCEFAAGLIEKGRYAEAHTLLDTVLTAPESREFHADAAHLSGVALDAQGQHKAAERLFRQALENWQGDATSVMNNLGLNLASQGMFDEALNTLRKAQIMAPEKIEIARNIQIVSELRTAVVPKAPVDLKK